MYIEKILDYIFQLGASFGTKLISAILIFVIGSKLLKLIKKRTFVSEKFKKLDPGVQSFFSSFITVALYIVLFITVAMILGIPTTSFITALASCGVAISLALQGALGNLAGGIMLLIFKPFKVGDYISTQGEEGVVSKITIMYTSVKTIDNKIVTMPNGTLTNAVVKNYSAEELRRVDLTFCVSYNSDADKVKKILMDVMLSHDKILKDPQPFARLSAHGDSSLEYTTRAWCNTTDYWDVYFDLMEQVKKAFDENGISIPYPQMDVHIENNN